MTGIRVRGVTKSFRLFTRKQSVLRGVDLDVMPGEVVGLIGPNGAGKTTLMSCLLGYLHTDSGSITIDDHANDDLAVRRRTGFVPERLNFDRTVSVRPFLRYMARLAELPPAQADRRVDELMERMSIAYARRKRLSQLSRGMLQRVVMCQALVNNPMFLFLDEPASGLDPNGVLTVRDIIAEQKQRGAAVLLNSHQLAEVEKVCDRVFFLSDGVISQRETLRGERVSIAITLLPGYDAARVMAIAGSEPADGVLISSVANNEAVAALVRDLVNSGVGIVEVRRHTADLEKMFR